MRQKFAEKVENEVLEFFDKYKDGVTDKEGNVERPFLNELDVQLHLARYLQRPEREVYLEYFVPNKNKSSEKGLVEGYPWNSDIYIDIVVSEGKGKDRLYYLIELKYKTKSIERGYACFGDTLPNVELLKNHGAHDFNCYDFWRDVKRIECLEGRTGVVGGIAVFLTNDPLYWKGPGANAGYSAFSIAENRGPIAEEGMEWTGSSVAKDSEERGKAIKLSKNYQLEWKGYSQDGAKRDKNEFMYCYVSVDPEL